MGQRSDVRVYSRETWRKTIRQMPVTVEITDASLLKELVAALTRSGCLVAVTTCRACRVFHKLASSDDEALLEVAFFVRAWQLRHPGVGAEITP